MIESRTEGWSDSDTGWTKTHLSLIQDRPNKKKGENVTCFNLAKIDKDKDLIV